MDRCRIDVYVYRSHCMYECICEPLQAHVVIFVHASCKYAWLYVYLSVRVMVAWCLVAHGMLMWCDVM